MSLPCPQLVPRAGWRGFLQVGGGKAAERRVRDMTAEETTFFQVVDEYSRNRHACFLAEMFPNKAETGYKLCFRPSGVEPGSPRVYDCQYLEFGSQEVAAVGRTGVLSPSLTVTLDHGLAKLRRSE